MRTTRGLHRLIGAKQSRTIPDTARCPVCVRRGIVGRKIECIVLSALERHYACREHGERAKVLGHEVFDGEVN